MFEQITASEVAGYAVGALLLSATISAPKIDSFISSSQRSSLGMCKRCGDVNRIPCRKCKGSGRLIKQGGAFTLIPIVSDKSTAAAVSCGGCRGRGCFSCPDCSSSNQP